MNRIIAIIIALVTGGIGITALSDASLIEDFRLALN